MNATKITLPIIVAFGSFITGCASPEKEREARIDARKADAEDGELDEAGLWGPEDDKATDQEWEGDPLWDPRVKSKTRRGAAELASRERYEPLGGYHADIEAGASAPSSALYAYGDVGGSRTTVRTAPRSSGYGPDTWRSGDSYERQMADLRNQNSRLHSRLADMEDENAQLRRQIDQLRRQPAARPSYSSPAPSYPQAASPAPIPSAPSVRLPQGTRVDGSVTGYEPAMGAVVLSVGTSSGVQAGATFTVFRGSTFIAKVRVEKPMSNFSGARVVYTAQGVAIQQGDSAAWTVGQD